MERMKEAYGMLYAIETGLRQYIDNKMTLHYGADWQLKAPKNMPFRRYPLNQSYFYHLENYIHAFSCFDCPDELIINLRKLYPIRNKIAHCRELTEDEYRTLENAYERIMDVVCSKVC